MSITFTMEEFPIADDTVVCEVDLFISDYGEAPAPASLNYPGDPGEPPTYEVEEIRLVQIVDDQRGMVLVLNETQFETFFSDGADVLTNAYEWASEQEVEREDDHPWD